MAADPAGAALGQVMQMAGPPVRAAAQAAAPVTVLATSSSQAATPPALAPSTPSRPPSTPGSPSRAIPQSVVKAPDALTRVARHLGAPVTRNVEPAAPKARPAVTHVTTPALETSTPKTAAQTITRVRHAVATVAAPLTNTPARLLAEITHAVTGVTQTLTHTLAGLTGGLTNPLAPLAKAVPGAVESAGPSARETLARALADVGDIGPRAPSGGLLGSPLATPAGASGVLALAAASNMAGMRPILGWAAGPASTFPPAGGVSMWGAGGAAGDGSGVASGVPPGPAPIQGVAFPASAGAPGFGFSTFLMLAGLLVLGALLVSGRLRLSSELWRPAPVVLILDRPG
jgi:hypothetical protein